MNENVNPLSTAAVVVISSPKNTGIVPVPAAIPLPTIEPAFLFANTIVISSDCPNGPKEVLNNGDAGYLFKVNSEEDFLSIFNKFYSEKKEVIFNKKIRGKVIARNYSLFCHYKVLEEILLI
jgi:glycosyltransferase involved in cell wall biosynthesis